MPVAPHTPLQQSAAAEQAWPLAWQAQWPLTQSMLPQHSTEWAVSEQAPPAFMQHSSMVGEAR